MNEFKMDDFLKRLNDAYEREPRAAFGTDADDFDNQYNLSILFRVTVNSLIEYRKNTGKYNRKGWDDIDRYEPITDSEKAAMYRAIINFGK